MYTVCSSFAICSFRRNASVIKMLEPVGNPRRARRRRGRELRHLWRALVILLRLDLAFIAGHRDTIMPIQGVDGSNAHGHQALGAGKQWDFARWIKLIGVWHRDPPARHGCIPKFQDEEIQHRDCDGINCQNTLGETRPLPNSKPATRGRKNRPVPPNGCDFDAGRARLNSAVSPRSEPSKLGAYNCSAATLPPFEGFKGEEWQCSGSVFWRHSPQSFC